MRGVERKKSRVTAVIKIKANTSPITGDSTIDAPIFVLTHHPPTEGEWSPQVRFVTNLDDALAQAQAVAGDRVVSVSGADPAQQLLRMGKIDAIRVSVVRETRSVQYAV